MNVAIIGLGKVGTNLAYTLSGLKYTISGLYSRSQEKVNNLMKSIGVITKTDLTQVVSDSDVVFITVCDDAIESVTQKINETFSEPDSLEGKVFLHTSGAKPSTLLECLKDKGANIGSMHPLQTFSTEQEIDDVFMNICFGVEGDDEAIEVANSIAYDMRSMAFPITTEGKPYYHMAACFVSNYMCVLTDIAERLLTQAGMPDICGIEIMAPLMFQGLDNVFCNGSVASLTGPISRCDISTVSKHLEVLNEAGREDMDILGLYKMLGMYAVSMAADKGAYTKETLDKMYSTIMEEKDD